MAADAPFLGEICIFPFTFAPNGWAECAGRLLPISSNTALFSLLGTKFGGDGVTTFALPNMRSASPEFPGDHKGFEGMKMRYYINLVGMSPQRP